jgi:hypothetical protein
MGMGKCRREGRGRRDLGRGRKRSGSRWEERGGGSGRGSALQKYLQV